MKTSHVILHTAPPPSSIVTRLCYVRLAVYGHHPSATHLVTFLLQNFSVSHRPAERVKSVKQAEAAMHTHAGHERTNPKWVFQV